MKKIIDVQGRALLDFFLGKEDVPLILHTSYGDPEEMPVEVFFREAEDFTKLEKFALRYCKGRILDVGAGAGSFSVELQAKGLSVAALEISPFCCRIMQQRGVKEVEEANFWEYSRGNYNTILLMMNGIGLAGEVARLPEFLLKLKAMLAPGGQIICDSSDISYLYAGTKKPADHYFGEIRYCYEYEGEKGEWFGWLYADPALLSQTCRSVGMEMSILYKNRNDQFLAKITAGREG